jgi:hypothetical protein
LLKIVGGDGGEGLRGEAEVGGEDGGDGWEGARVVYAAG